MKQVQALLHGPFYFRELDRLGGDNELVFALNQNGVVIAQVGTAQGVDKNSVPRGVAKIGDPIPYLFNWPWHVRSQLKY